VCFFFVHVGSSRDTQNEAATGIPNKTTTLSVIQRMALQGNKLRNEAKLNSEKSVAPKRSFPEVLTPEDVSRRLWQEFGYAPQRSFPKFQASNEDGSQSLNSSQPKRMVTKFRVWMFLVFDVIYPRVLKFIFTFEIKCRILYCSLISNAVYARYLVW
jgi:hypothetical protein